MKGMIYKNESLLYNSIIKKYIGNCQTTVSFAASLHETIFTLYGGQSVDCSPTRYTIVCVN